MAGDEANLNRFYYLLKDPDNEAPFLHLEDKIGSHITAGRSLLDASFFSNTNPNVNLREQGRYTLRMKKKVHSEDHTLIAAYSIAKHGYIGRKIDLACLSIILRQGGIDESGLISFIESCGFSSEPPEIEAPGEYKLWIDNILHPSEIFKSEVSQT